jgi:hypothetical protein
MAYDNPHGLIAAATIVQTLVLGMLVLRFASHKMEGLKFHTSDYLIIVPGILSTALATEQIYCKYPAPRALMEYRIAYVLE